MQNYTDVEIETSEGDESAQAVEELKEDIEEGNVLVLSAAERATSSGSTVTLTRGELFIIQVILEIILLACSQ